MKKQLITILSIICVLTTLSACGNKFPIALSGDVQDHTEQKEILSWNDSHIALDRRFDVAVVEGDTIYGAYINTAGLIAVSQDMQSGNILKEVEITGVSEISDIAADSWQNVYIAGTQGDKNCFWKVDSNGQVTVWDNVKLEDSVYSNYSFPPQLKKIVVDEKGYFYLWYELEIPYHEFVKEAEPDIYVSVDRIYVKDNELNTLYYDQIPDSDGSKMLGFSLDRAGTPIILAHDIEGFYIRELGAEKESDTSRLSMDEMALSYTQYTNITMTDEKVLFCQENELYQYLFEDQSCKKMMNLASYGIHAADILFLGSEGETIRIIDNYTQENTSEYTALQPGESDKTCLTLGIVSGVYDHVDLENTVMAFNRFQDDIRVEIVNYYTNGSSFDDGVEQLKLDIIRGKAPDILEVSMIDCDIFAKKGLWVDLYSFMEQDQEFPKDILIANIAEIYELDGHLYNIAPLFVIHSMWGNESVIQGWYGVSYHDLIQILQDNGKDINAVHGSFDMESLCDMGMDEFIDWQNGTCDFEGDAFKQVLEFIKEYEGNYVGGKSLFDGIRGGEILMSAGMLRNVAEYQIQKELYGHDIDFIGYPVQNGTGTAVSFWGSELAVSSNGKDLDAAWQFVKYFLLNAHDENGFPVIKEQFEAKMLQAMEKEYAMSAEGMIEYPKGSYWIENNDHILVYEASQEDVDAIRQLIERADRRYNRHPEIENIINEEAAAYFTGQKSLEGVAALIQNRVSLYLAEQMN